MNFKLVSEVKDGYYLIEKAGQYFIYSIENNETSPLTKTGNIWESDTLWTKKYITYTNSYSAFFDKDLNFIGIYSSFSNIEGSQDKLAQLYRELNSDDDNSIVLVNVETGEVIGKYSEIENTTNSSQYYKGGYMAVKDNKGNWGFLKADGKEILPVKYKDILIFRNVDYVLATLDDNNTILANTEGEIIHTYPFGAGNVSYIRAGLGDFLVTKTVNGNIRTYYTPSGNHITLTDGVQLKAYYDQKGNHVGWKAADRIGDNTFIYTYYDRQLKKIREEHQGPRDVAAEVYKKRDFVGRPLAILQRMQDKGYITGGDMLYGGRLGTIFTIVLKDKSRYRIEMDRNGCIIKTTKY
ncbi:MAG: hypothetical protein NC217_03210 [Muribaculaceae bacterium]|nr:hypothetical protein [Muribaculaceae bacterium]